MTSLSDCARPEIALPGQYQFIDQIGEGVNGAIFRARDRNTGAEVILKCFASQQRGAYLREMAASFGLSHPNIARCLDTFYLADGSGWMVYQFLPDGTLRDLLQAQGRPELKLVLKCLRDLLNALGYLHRLGLIHCDVKPENLLVRRAPGALADFVLGDLGAASFVREAYEGRHTTGSPAYAAPERLFDRFSFNSDLYSVGVLGFEMLAGHRPFVGSPLEIYRAQLNKPPPLEDIEHPYLRDLIEQLLQRDPQQRLPSADAALHLLTCIEQGHTGVERVRPSRQRPPLPRLRQRPVALAGLVRREEFAVVEPPPAGVLGMACGERPVVGLVYDQHIEFWQDAQPAALPVILNVGPVQVVTADTLVYATGSRLLSLNVVTRERECLRDHCQQLLGFHYWDQRLLWCSPEGGYLHDLHRGTQISYRSPLYFLYPQLRLLEDGWFLASAGPVNQQAVLRDAEAKVVMRWNLNGPIMGWTSEGSRILAISMDMQGHQHYTLWRLSLDDGVARRPLPTTPRHWCFTPGNIFWVGSDGDLYRCGTDLEPNRLGDWEPALRAFNVSPDHRFFTALRQTDRGGSAVAVWENINSST